MTIVLKKKSCFIITPIGADNSEVRRHADGVIEEVIRPLLQGDYGKIEASHNSNRSGSITNEIINNIYEADLVIANLTYLNPNVMYEVALRHAVAKPIIHIVCGDITKDLPFDIKDYRTIFYKDDIMGTKELKDRLIAMMKEIDMRHEAKDNPIYNALKSRDIDNLIKKDKVDDNPNAITNLMLGQILDKLKKLEGNTIEYGVIKNIRSSVGIYEFTITHENITKKAIKDYLETYGNGSSLIVHTDEGIICGEYITKDNEERVGTLFRELSNHFHVKCEVKTPNGNMIGVSNGEVFLGDIG